jgi:uncharacterized integral membrane protein
MAPANDLVGDNSAASPTVTRSRDMARGSKEATAMRYLYIMLVAAFTILVVVFMGQNLQSATVSFFSWSLTLPISIIALLCYGLGMLTGGFLLSSLRSWIRGATPGSR